ncbi:MAG: glycosyltransferase [Planctomycetota bacterium]
MKLLFFVHNFPPEFRGGTEQVVLGLARSFRDGGDEVVVVSGSERTAPGGRLVEEVVETGDGRPIRVRRLLRAPEERYGLLLNYPATGERIGAILAEERPDFVHVHHWSTLGMDLVQRSVALGIPAGVTLHDPWVTCARFFRRPPRGIRCPSDATRKACVSCVGMDMEGRPLEDIAAELGERDAALRRELGLASFVAVPSAATAALISRHLPMRREDLDVIPHGLLREPAGRALPREGDVPLRVGSFGNLVPDKGIDLLVEALAGLGDQVELQLAGHCPDPAYRQHLERLADKLKVPLRWIGPFGEDDPHPALDMDIAVFPSLCQETYGLVVEEALAHGVPVVVSQNGALPERAARGGVVVRSGGVMPLHIALSTLLRSRAQLETLRDEIADPGSFPRIGTAAGRYRELIQAAIATADPRPS